MLKLKPSYLFKQKMEGDVGFLSLCCKYHWLIKKLSLKKRLRINEKRLNLKESKEVEQETIVEGRGVMM